MSKSIYERAREILLNMGTEFISIPCNPIGEENSDMIHLRDVTETYETNMHEVVKALEQAQKQEKLLKLYKELISLKNDMFSYCEVVDDIYYYMAETETDLEQQIKEIENEI